MQNRPATFRAPQCPGTLLGLAWMMVLLGLVAGCRTGPAGNPSAVDVDRLVTDYYALRASDAVGPTLTMDDALAVQGAMVSRLEERAGSRVGYKVGLVTQEAQKRYGVEAPVRGVLLSGMLLTNGVSWPARFGVAPLCEADLVVVVKDKGINKARSVSEAAQHLSEVVAFMELPDGWLATNQTVTGAMLTAANVGARYGVLGQRIPMQTNEEFLRSLANMTITVSDQDGNILAKEEGRKILDHPLHAVLWLSEELNRSGQSLKPGDLISLGGVHMRTPQPGQTITVTYENLAPIPLIVQATFH